MIISPYAFYASKFDGTLSLLGVPNTIGEYAFADNSNLSGHVVISLVHRVGAYAFSGTKVTITD